MVTWPLFGTFWSLYLPNAWSQTLQTSKGQTFRDSALQLVWGKTVSCRLCAVCRLCEGTLKRRKKCFFLDLAPPTLQNSEIFHDSTRPHLHSDGLPPKSRRSVVSYIGLRMRYKYYKEDSSGLAWSPRADGGLSRPTSVFRTTIGVCTILSRSVEIWQYNGQKPVME